MEAAIPRSPEAGRATDLASLLEKIDQLDRANNWLRGQVENWRTAALDAVTQRDDALLLRDRANSDREEALRARDSAGLERDEAGRTLAVLASRLRILEQSRLHRAAVRVRRIALFLRGQ